MTPAPSPVARPGIRTAGLCAVLALLAGCSHRSVATVSGTVPLNDSVKRIRIEVDNGMVQVGTPDPEDPSPDLVYQGGVRRDATSDEGLKRIEEVPIELVAEPDAENPGTLVVRGPSAPAGVEGMIAFEAGIRIPAEYEVEVVVRDNGHVTVAGRRAYVEVRTHRGDLRFDDCRGGVRATTGQGVLIVYQHHGDLDVRTDMGDMQAFVASPGEELTLSTGKGTVQCLIPEETGFEVDARVEIGRIGNDFDLPVRKVGDYSAALTGRHGDGRTRLILRTASGHIALRHWDQK